jgi:hypothetical protein
MKCEEFKSLVQGELDQIGNGVLSTALHDHANTCIQCGAFFESLTAVHSALRDLPRVTPSAELMTALRRIDKPVYVPMELSWGPDIRLAAAMVTPVLLPYIAEALSYTLLQQIFEMSILALGVALFAIAALKPRFLGGPEYRIVPDKS